MAERLFKKTLKQGGVKGIKVSSRGIHAKGDNIAVNAKLVLKEMGALASDRKSVQLKKIDKSTLYVAMTDSIKKSIEGKNVIAMSALIGEEILDPYGQDVEVYRRVAKQLQNAIFVLLDKILKARGEK